MARPRVLPEGSERVSYFLSKPTKDILEAYCKEKSLQLSDVLRTAASAYAEELVAKDKLPKQYRDIYDKATAAISELKDNPFLMSSEDTERLAVFAEIKKLNIRFATHLKGMAEYIGLSYAHEYNKKICSLMLRIFVQYASFLEWYDEFVDSLEKVLKSVRTSKNNLPPNQKGE